MSKELTLDLHLFAAKVPYGAEVRAQLVLTNVSDRTLELASLRQNNEITNLLLYDDEGEPMGAFNHVSRQLMLEKIEPRRSDVLMIQLAPGAQDEAEVSLTRWHWIEVAGSYALAARYAYEDHDVTSEAHPFDLEAAPLHHLHSTWSYHYGDRFVHRATWTVQNRNRHYDTYLRTSTRYGPQVVEYARRVYGLPDATQPRVAFDVTPLSGPEVWLGWLEGPELCLLQTRDGEPEGLEQRHLLGLQGAEVRGYVTDRSRHVLLLESRGIVHAVAIDDAGPGRPQVFGRQDEAYLVPDHEGALFVVLRAGHQVKVAQLDPTGLRPAREVIIDLDPESTPRGLAVPPVFEAEYVFAALATRPSGALETAWLGAFDAPAVLNEAEVAAPAGAIKQVLGDVDRDGQVYWLVRTDQRLAYVQASLQQSLPVRGAELLWPAGPQALWVSARGDVHVSFSERGQGLTEPRMHGGGQEDLYEEGDS